jgi:hypothetical protein
MNREVQVRICEWLGLQFPGPTRRLSWKRTHEAMRDGEIGDKPSNSRLFPEVADGVTGNGNGYCVSFLREPEAGNPHIRFDERVVSRRREIVLLYER